MNGDDVLIDPKGARRLPVRQRMLGVYPALVTDVDDPDSQGRVEVKLPWVADDDGEQARAWARLSTLMAGADRGTWFIPEVDDEVVISFFGGDPRRPVVMGALWNGVDAPPETMQSGNPIRSVTSRSGHKLTFDDTSGAEAVKIETQAGHVVHLDDASGGKITVEHLNGAKIEIDTAGKVSISALTNLEVDAPAGVTVNSPMSRFSGVVQADTVITNAVISTSYTPGAGNVW